MMRRFSALVLAAAAALLSGPAPAAPVQDERAQGQTPPLPPPRPAEIAAPAPEEARTGAEASPPLPPPRPPAEHAAEEQRSDPDAKPEDAAEAALCRGRLEALGVRFEAKPTFHEGVCGAAEPVLVRSLPGGVEVAPPSLMTCPLAEALTRWVTETVQAEAERRFEGRPTRLAIGTSYECRDQRNGAKLSEHAFANGLDVMGFGFERKPAFAVGFKPDGSADAGFQAAIRSAACVHFTTVLGPGSDPDHADHLHLDMRARQRGYRICQ